MQEFFCVVSSNASFTIARLYDFPVPFLELIVVCRINNILAFPRSVTIEDLQQAVYGKDLGLLLPVRDPWSRMSLADVKKYDVPELDRTFTTPATVSVYERLAAMAGWDGGVASEDIPAFRHARRLTALRLEENLSQDSVVPSAEIRPAGSEQGDGSHDYNSSDDLSGDEEALPGRPLRGGAGVTSTLSTAHVCCMLSVLFMTANRAF